MGSSMAPGPRVPSVLLHIRIGVVAGLALLRRALVTAAWRSGQARQAVSYPAVCASVHQSGRSDPAHKIGAVTSIRRAPSPSGTDEEATDIVTLEEFLSAELPGLSRFAGALTGDPHLAEDILSDALLVVVSPWRRIAATENPVAYVRRIVVDTASSESSRPRPTTMVRRVPPCGWRRSWTGRSS